MKLIKKLIASIKQWRCNHVYIDLLKIGYQRCIFCDKERPKTYEQGN